MCVSHDDATEYLRLLRYYAVLTGKYLPTLRKITLTAHSGSSVQHNSRPRFVPHVLSAAQITKIGDSKFENETYGAVLCIDNILDACSKGTLFKSLFGHWLFCLTSPLFLSDEGRLFFLLNIILNNCVSTTTLLHKVIT